MRGFLFSYSSVLFSFTRKNSRALIPCNSFCIISSFVAFSYSFWSPCHRSFHLFLYFSSLFLLICRCLLVFPLLLQFSLPFLTLRFLFLSSFHIFFQFMVTNKSFYIACSLPSSYPPPLLDGAWDPFLHFVLPGTSLHLSSESHHGLDRKNCGISAGKPSPAEIHHGSLADAVLLPVSWWP